MANRKKPRVSPAPKARTTSTKLAVEASTSTPSSSATVTERGSMLKAVVVNRDGSTTQIGQSQQIPDDQFASLYSAGVREPLYNLEQLALLTEAYTTHGACVDQATSDIVGSGWNWLPRSHSINPENTDQRAALIAWFESLAPPDDDTATMLEVTQAGWSDYEATAQTHFELIRDIDGNLKQMFPIPAHTIRIDADERRLLHIRNGRQRWFKRWGATDVAGKPIYLNSETGDLINPGEVPFDLVANEVYTIRRWSRRSSYYGIPPWISAVGWMTLALAARDYNLLFFANRREPNWLVLIQGVANAEAVQSAITEAMRTQLAEPHRNLVMALEDGGEVAFHKLSDDQPEQAFRNLLTSCEDITLLAHRMPPDRVGLSRRRGPLGGSVASVTNRVYREGKVKPAQMILAGRLNRFVDIEFRRAHGLAKPGDKPIDWLITPNELDITEEHQDLRDAIAFFGSGMATIDEGRKMAGFPPVGGDRGIKYSDEIGLQKMPTGPEGGMNSTNKSADQLDDEAGRAAEMAEAQLELAETLTEFTPTLAAVANSLGRR